MKCIAIGTGIVGCLLSLVLSLPVYGEAETQPSDPLPASEYVFQVDALRLQTVRLRLPAGEVLDYTEKGDAEDAPWKVQFAATPENPTLWRLQLTQVSGAVRREVAYWLYVPAATEEEMGPMEPLFVTETAFDIDTGAYLFRRQSMEWTLRFGVTSNSVALERVAPWILRHLDLVYDIEVLTICSDYFWHDPGDDEPATGFEKCIACTNRCIELDPQAEDLYTFNAWLLWSDWVTWQLDPNRVPDGDANLGKAIRLIQKGRAANPSSAAYHLDAADTLFPLAQHHRPELMDMVIRYYRYAEALATDKDMHIRIRKCLGHRYRDRGDPEAARHWYQAVLELDPQDRVAIRCLEQLTPSQEDTFRQHREPGVKE